MQKNIKVKITWCGVASVSANAYGKKGRGQKTGPFVAAVSTNFCKSQTQEEAMIGVWKALGHQFPKKTQLPE